MKLVISYAIDIILSLFVKCLKLDNNLIIFNSTANVNYNFNSKFLFESMICNELFSNKKIYFVINDNLKRDELNKKIPGKFISSRSMRGRFLCLKAKIWITSTIETPVYGLSKHADRIVYHLGHGVPLKNIGLAECNLSIIRKINRKLRVRLFTHVTCYTPMFDEFFKKAFDNCKINLLHFGQPRNDTLLENKKLSDVSSTFKKSTFCNVLYSPTWRPYESTKFFPFDDFSIDVFHNVIERNNIKFYIREHPYFKAEIPEGLFNSHMVVNLNSSTIGDITPYLNEFDVLITDYSSIYLDFLTIKKKVIYIPYDISLYESSVGFSMPYESLISGDIVLSFKDMLERISNNFCGSLVGDDFLYTFNLKPTGNCHEHMMCIRSLLSE